MLSDFGVSVKALSDEPFHDCRGTILYFAPEMLTEHGHSRYVDFWALGILAH